MNKWAVLQRKFKNRLTTFTITDHGRAKNYFLLATIKMIPAHPCRCRMSPDGCYIEVLR